MNTVYKPRSNEQSGPGAVPRSDESGKGEGFFVIIYSFPSLPAVMENK